MKNDLNFYLKWAGTVVLIIGTAINSLGYYPAGPLILGIGGLIWLIVSIRWREPALVTTNFIMTFTGFAGLAYRYFS
jgi:hypothetical protein